MNYRSELIQEFREGTLFIDIQGRTPYEIYKLIPIFEEENILPVYTILKSWLKECSVEGWEYLGYSKNGWLDAYHKPLDNCKRIMELEDFIERIEAKKEIEIKIEDVTNIFAGST